MHWVVLGGRIEVLRLLLEKRAWAEGADGADDTPLHLAARCAPLHCACSSEQQ